MVEFKLFTFQHTEGINEKTPLTIYLPLSPAPSPPRRDSVTHGTPRPTFGENQKSEFREN